MTKQEVAKCVYQELLNSPKARFDSYVAEIENKTGRSLTYEESTYINDIIWDLIVARVVTPGLNRTISEWPAIRVTDEARLKEMLAALK